MNNIRKRRSYYDRAHPEQLPDRAPARPHYLPPVADRKGWRWLRRNVLVIATPKYYLGRLRIPTRSAVVLYIRVMDEESIGPLDS
jgi:hypothetical protein